MNMFVFSLLMAVQGSSWAPAPLPRTANPVQPGRYVLKTSGGTDYRVTLYPDGVFGMTSITDTHQYFGTWHYQDGELCFSYYAQGSDEPSPTPWFKEKYLLCPGWCGRARPWCTLGESKHSIMRVK